MINQDEYLASVDSKPLTGSEKQVSWATKLRHETCDAAVREVTAGISKGIAQGADKANPAKFEAQTNMLFAALESLARHADAKFWIESRGVLSMSLLAKEMVR